MSPKKKNQWLEAAYLKCLPRVQALLYKFVGSRSIAEDLAQDAFLRTLESPTFDAEKGGEAYLFVVASNIARDRSVRLDVAKTDQTADFDDFMDEESCLEQLAIRSDAWALIAKSMTRLPEREQRVLVSFALGYTCRETAEKLQVSRMTVQRSLAKALETVQDARKRVDGENARLLDELALPDCAKSPAHE